MATYSVAVNFVHVNERNDMVPVYVDMGADVYVNALEILAIVEYHENIEFSMPVNPKEKVKAAILTTTGLSIPGYRAPNILARRWEEAFSVDKTKE